MEEEISIAKRWYAVGVNFSWIFRSIWDERWHGIT
jgi:hypothetical protein